MIVQIHHGDCRDVLDALAPESVHAVVTDPPYHLTAGKRGGTGEASVNLDSPHGRARITAGFMGKKWDGGDVAFDPATWRKVLRVMKPGAYLLAFGGTRTYHRLACAIEDAGFEVRDMVSWLYGSGFPKGTDKAKIPPEWQGFNTALKPAQEPICLARKPMVGALAENLQRYGCGALNVDGCRIETEGRPLRELDAKGTNSSVYVGRVNGGEGFHGGSKAVGETDVGRWPANVVHDGSEEVLEHFPDAPGQIADASSSSSRKTQHVYGAMKRGNGREGEASAERRYTDEGGTDFAMLPGQRRGDEGSAARFFYCAKADREDRNDGLHGMPKKLWPEAGGVRTISAGTQGGYGAPRANHHPTVKPTDLMVWLCKLVTPPGGIILDPFMGSGSTGRGALLGDFGFIGIEGEDEYIEIAERRIRAIAPLLVRCDVYPKECSKP